MRYLKTIDQDIENLCKGYGIGYWTIDGDGFVDVDGGVYFNYKQLENIPIKFGKVSGYFDCSFNHLSSLEGCPKEIGGWFSCSDNQLAIIDYLPLKIGGGIDLSYNKIKNIRVERKSYVFGGICCLEGNPIEGEFEEWNGDLIGLIKNLNRLRKINEILENN